MTWFDPTLEYPDAFLDAVARATDRVTSDEGTQRIADDVNARMLAADLDRHVRHRANTASARQRHGRDGANVPDVVHNLCDDATSCHVATGKVSW